MSSFLFLPRRIIFWTSLILLTSICALAWQTYKSSPQTVGFWAFNVPGDALFLVFPDGYHLLVDSGENAEAAAKIANTLPFWSREIDIFFLTHADRDHIGGALSILQQYKVKSIVLPGNAEDSLLFVAIVAEAARQNIPLVYANSQTDFRIGSVVLDILYPQQSLLAKELPKRNVTSPLMRLTTGKESVLFTGDAEKPTEKLVLKTPVRLQSTILKSPHHGSKSSSTEDFINAVAPQTAVISAHIDNPYGHPHAEVVQRYQDKQIALFNTGKIGDIHLRIFDSFSSSLPSL